MALRGLTDTISTMDIFGIMKDHFRSGRLCRARGFSRALSTVILCMFLGAPASVHAGTIINRPFYSGLTDGLVGYWTFDGPDVAGVTAYDRSGQGNNGTLTSSPTRATGKIGQGMRFNNDGYVNTTDISQMDSASKVTIAGWFKRAAAGALTQVSKGTDCNIDGCITITFYTDGALHFDLASGSDAYGVIAHNDTEWHHVALVFDGTQTGNQGRLKGYIDGVERTLDYEGTTIPATTGAYNSNFQIGRNSTDGTLSSGLIDDVRIYNRAITADEVKRLYNMGGTFKIGVSRTDTLTDRLAGHWTFDGPDVAGTTAYDRSGNSITGALTGGITTTLGKIGQALNLNGTSGYVALTDNAIFDLTPSGSYTWSFWVKPAAFTAWSNLWNIFTSSQTGPYLNMALHTCTTGTCGDDWGGVTQGLVVGWMSDFSGACPSPQTNCLVVQSNDNVFATNKWAHVVVTYDGSLALASRFKIYVDGVNQTEGASASNGTLPSISPSIIYLGWDTWPGEYFNGTIDDVRYYTRVFSTDEIKRLYNMGGTFTTNASRKDTLTDGLVGHWTFDGADVAGTTAYDRSGSGHTGTLTNPSRVVGKIGQGLEFTQTSARADMGAPSTLSMPGAVSLCTWVKWSSFPASDDFFFGEYNNGGDQQQYALVIATNGSMQFYWTDGASELYSTAAGTIALNTWYHVCGVRISDSNVQIYINGVAQTVTPSGGATIRATLSTSIIAGNTPGGTSGISLDDARIYNRAISSEEVRRLYNMGR